MFKYCPECGARIRKDAVFCEGCGQKLLTIEDIENEIQTKYMDQLEEKIRVEKDLEINELEEKIRVEKDLEIKELEEKIRTEKEQEIETLKKKINDEKKKNRGLHYGWRAILHKYINYIIAFFSIALFIGLFHIFLGYMRNAPNSPGREMIIKTGWPLHVIKATNPINSNNVTYELFGLNFLLNTVFYFLFILLCFYLIMRLFNKMYVKE